MIELFMHLQGIACLLALCSSN